MCEGLKERLEFNETYTPGYRDPDERIDGYQLKWIGKEYAHWRAGSATETMIYPDETHNSKPENINSKNIFITGDNLEALKQMRKAYRNSVNIIYIDPPYNTGNDDFVYKDKYILDDDILANSLNFSEDEIRRLRSIEGKASHSAWLSFMYPRLRIAHELLAEDGVIFISIDDNEQSNLKLLCDEIFGESNFIGNLIWQTKNSARGVPPKTLLKTTHEYVLCYAKNIDQITFNGLPRSEADFNNIDNDPRGLWRNESMQATGKQNNYFSITNPENGMQFFGNWAFSKTTIEKMINDKLILFPSSENKIPRQKKFYNSYTNATKSAITSLGCYSTEIATNEFMELFKDKKIFDFPKPLALIKFFIGQINIKPNPIILDFFAGSGTTAHAVMELNKEDGGNRSYILCQLDEPTSEKSLAYKEGYKTIDEISRKRIELAAEKLKDASGYKHYYVKEPNNNILRSIKEFNPSLTAQIDAFIPQDYINLFADKFKNISGEQTILTTWLLQDRYKFTEQPEIIDIEGYKAYYINKSLYLLYDNWQTNHTEALLNLIGTGKLICDTIIIYGYSFNSYKNLAELKINKNILTDNYNIDIIQRY